MRWRSAIVLEALAVACGGQGVTVESIQPAAGPTAGGTLVQIRGSSLSPVSAVLFGHEPGLVVARSDERIDVVTPHGTVGWVDVSVTWNDGERRPLPGAFGYDVGGGSGTFRDATAERLPREAWRVQDAAVGDLDRDGDVDLVLPGYFGTQDRLLRNRGAQLADDTAASLPDDASQDVHAEAGDVDGDGDLDLYLAAEGADRLLINDGSGHYDDESAGRLPPDEDFSEGADFGDVDGDHDLDIVVANLGAGTGEPERLLLNRGDGFFEDASDRLPEAADPSYTAELVDLDGDGDLDLAVGNYGAPSRILDNDGAGTFTERRSAVPGPPGNTTALSAGDADGDGDPDLYEARFLGPDRLLLNRGDGSFVDASDQIPVEASDTYDAQFADLDGDGDLDLAIARTGAPNRVLLNDGAGRYEPPEDFPSDDDRSYSVDIGDVDGDGALDLVYTSWAGDQTLLYLNGGPPDAETFRVDRVSPVEGPTIGGTTIDVRGGGFLPGVAVLVGGQPLGVPEVVDPTWLRGVVPPGIAGPADVEVSLPDGSQATLPGGYLYLAPREAGPFMDATAENLPPDGGPSSDLALRDLDGDGALDILLGRQGERDLLYIGSGSGSFRDETAARLPDEVGATQAVAVGDLDLDGDQDVLIARELGIRRLQNDGRGRFSRAAWPGDSVAGTTALGVADVDGDLLLDVVAARSDLPDVLLASARGYEPEELPLDPGPTTGVQVADFDDDGSLDILLTRFAAADALLSGDGQGGFSERAGALPDDAAWQSYGAAVGDLDLDGDPDIVVALGGANGRNRVWRNDDGAFSDVTDATLPEVIYGTSAVVLAEIDGDRGPDLLEVNWWGSDWLYANDGEGHLRAWTALPEAEDLSALAGAVGDVDGDGDADIVIACAGNRTRLFLSR